MIFDPFFDLNERNPAPKGSKGPQRREMFSIAKKRKKGDKGDIENVPRERPAERRRPRFAYSPSHLPFFPSYFPFSF